MTKSLDKKVKQPKTESWEERFYDLIDCSLECCTSTDALFDLIQSEKQLSYQEGVENTVEKVEKIIGSNKRLKSTWDRETMAENSLRNDLRHQLSNLKEEKQK